MGIAIGLLPWLLERTANKPYSGEILTLGKQSIDFDREAFVRIAQETGFERASVKEDMAWGDHAFYAELGFQKSISLDASAYEGCDIIHDLNDANLSTELESRFDVVFDGGTLEHVFDTRAALACMVKACRVGGRIIHVNPASNCVDHGFYSFSPCFYNDYYAMNGFDVESLVLARIDQNQRSMRWDYSAYDSQRGLDSPVGGRDGAIYFLLCCVRKTPESTFDGVPQQGAYAKHAWRSH